MTKVTAIVSAYYADKWLEGRLDNLLSQSLVPEIIAVCQEGSKEVDILLKYQTVHTIVISVDKPVPTIYEAWNMAIKQAQGEYITNANCDDRLYPKALEKLARVLDENPKVAMSYFNVDIVKDHGQPPISCFMWMEGGIKELSGQGCFLGPMPMWRKSLHDKYGYFEDSYTLVNGEEYKPRVASDYEFWMRITAGGEKLKKINEVLGAYLKRDDQLEHKEKIRTIWETARAKAKYRRFYETEMI